MNDELVELVKSHSANTRSLNRIKVYFYDTIEPEKQRNSSPVHLSLFNYDIFVYISYLNCSNTGINYLPELYQCKTLICSKNKLRQLPKLPYCLKIICDNNFIYKVEDLPRCVYLDCSHNEITDIDVKLDKCKYLKCSNNRLKIIQNFPKCETLICNNNRINYIDKLPNCRKLICNNNRLKFIPLIKDIGMNTEDIECLNNDLFETKEFWIQFWKTPNRRIMHFLSNIEKAKLVLSSKMKDPTINFEDEHFIIIEKGGRELMVIFTDQKSKTVEVS